MFGHTHHPPGWFMYIYTELGRIICCTSWWFQPLWKILVSWDDYPQYMENKHVPNHQSVYVILNMYSSIISLEVTDLLPFLKWGHNYLCTGHNYQAQNVTLVNCQASMVFSSFHSVHVVSIPFIGIQCMYIICVLYTNIPICVCIYNMCTIYQY